MNGVRIDPVSPAEYLATVGSFLECGRAHVAHFCSAHPTIEARSDPAYRDLLNRGDLNLPDGAAVAWASRLNGTPATRLSGTEGLRLVVDWGIPRGLRHYLYGGSPETLEMMQQRLRENEAGIEIVGAESPPFRPLSDDEVAESVSRMRAAGAQAVWVGLGVPKQDFMAARLRELDAAPAIFCVGAAFDFVAGVVPRAPLWMQRSGLEWLYRLLSEPWRLWRRYLIGNPRFVAGVVSDRLRGRTHLRARDAESAP
ncbi:MAG: WecB/TagA/CpsF family glycosyltransferase [Actinomycetota bacterium]|nr:WecB/TagA/CpsF family glycosyltransferase [Actinomycetota bacterium]